MIPPDVANSLRLVIPDQQQLAQPQTQPVAAARQIADVLSNLVPGQRIMAEIQAMLPNGTYRATVAQRDITLALPFSAKAGDTLELEVSESDGKLTLAFVTNRTTAGANTNSQDSVTTSLSAAGKMIGDLVAGSEQEGKQATALNGSRPMVETMPKSAADLAPVLKQALTQSGMFYEAHQARWVAGELPLESLKQEPQGKITPPAMQAASDSLATTKTEGLNPQTQNVTTTVSAPHGQQIRSADNQQVPQEILPLVRQQLDGLANNNFAWQGQIWPGQQMRWEIGEESSQRRSPDDSGDTHWQSRLTLNLPSLGGIDATLRLQPGGKVALSLTTDSLATESKLRSNSEQLQQQLSTAGLSLTQLQIEHGQTDE